MTESLAAFFDTLEAIEGADGARAIERTMREPKRIGYRLNPLRGTTNAPGGEPIRGLAGCHAVPAAGREALMALPETTAGSIYPINPSSVLAARVLDVQPEQEVLDLAAAPGGKTLVLAGDMNNRGRIAAVEPVRARFHRMRANLARCGVEIVEFYLADGRGIGRKVPARFDRVLLDAPCSSEARFRLGDPRTFAHWKPRKVTESARKQRRLLRSAFTALKPGGKLLYCTCAFAPEENELVVDHLLRTETAARTLPFATCAPRVRPGLTEWAGRRLNPALAESVRVLPDDLWDGFFVCLLGKHAESALS